MLKKGKTEDPVPLLLLQDPKRSERL